MPEDDKNNIEDVVNDLSENISEIVGNTINGFGKTWVGNVKASPSQVKYAIAESPQIREMLEKFVKSYEQGRVELTAEVEDLGGQVLQLQETYKPFLTAFVEIIPDDLLESWASKLYESDPQNILLEAMEPRLYKLEEDSIKKAEDEDKNKAVEIGTVTQYHTDLGVAAIQLNEKLEKPLRVKDWVYIKGPETDFMQPVESMEIEQNKITEAKAGDHIGLKVQGVVKENSIVYRMV